MKRSGREVSLVKCWIIHQSCAKVIKLHVHFTKLSRFMKIPPNGLNNKLAMIYTDTLSHIYVYFILQLLRCKVAHGTYGGNVIINLQIIAKDIGHQSGKREAF